MSSPITRGTSQDIHLQAPKSFDLLDVDWRLVFRLKHRTQANAAGVEKRSSDDPSAIDVIDSRHAIISLTRNDTLSLADGPHRAEAWVESISDPNGASHQIAQRDYAVETAAYEPSVVL